MDIDRYDSAYRYIDHVCILLDPQGHVGRHAKLIVAKCSHAYIERDIYINGERCTYMIPLAD